MENFTIVLSVLATALGVFSTWQGISKNNKESFRSSVMEVIRGNEELHTMLESIAKTHRVEEELKIRTIEMTLSNLAANTATRSEMAEIRSDMKTLIARLDDLRDLIKSKS